MRVKKNVCVCVCVCVCERERERERERVIIYLMTGTDNKIHSFASVW